MSPVVLWTLVALSIVTVIAVIQGVIIWKIRQIKQKKDEAEKLALGLELEDAITKGEMNKSKRNQITPTPEQSFRA